MRKIKGSIKLEPQTTPGSPETGQVYYDSGSNVLFVRDATGFRRLISLDSASKLPAVDGSQLTNIPTSASSTEAIHVNSFYANSGSITFNHPDVAYEQNIDTTGLNNYVRYKVFLAPGTYKVGVLYNKYSSMGIVTVSVGGSSYGTFDGYAAGWAYGQVFESSTVTITTGASVDIELKVTDKNISGGYRMYISGIYLKRLT